MQAYARAELTPSGSEFRLARAPSVVEATPVAAGGEARVWSNGSESSASILASVILDGLDDYGLAVLASRLLPYLAQPAGSGGAGSHVAYTVASLSAELGVSQKAIRCAIARGELWAVKRGSRWIISADAVQAWAAGSDTRRRTGRVSGATTPKAAGPSLRSVLCGGQSRGGER